MIANQASFRAAGPRELAAALQDARHYTLALFEALAASGYDQAERVPRLACLNPPLWELGYTGWYAEWFVLRDAGGSHPGDAHGHSLLARGDDWFDAAIVPHSARWTLDLPPPGAIKTYCREVLDRILDRLARADADDAALLPFRLALAHEDRQGEALMAALQTLTAAAAGGLAPAPAVGPPLEPRVQIAFAGGTFMRGGEQAHGFAFDNERPAAPCRVAPFAIDAGLVTNAAYLDFVRDGGYQRAQYWTDAGRAWLMRQERSAPRCWMRAGADWHTVRFGRRAALVPAEPVRHVSLHEAQAWCVWAGRRLPAEEEWEYAATAGEPAFDWGQLWEWTASAFLPYPGFAPGRDDAYSAPCFGTHQALRGASFATPLRARSARFRQFLTPERDDAFTGFRSCAV